MVTDRSTPPALTTRSRILDAAWGLVAGRGRADVTMGEVADAVGISRQALYLHFPNRASMLLAMVQDFDDRNIDWPLLEGFRSSSPVDGLDAVVRWWLGYLPALLPIATALEAAALTGEDGSAAWSDRMGHLRDEFGLHLARVEAAGALAPGWTVATASDWVWARTHPAVWHALAEERDWEPAELVERLMRSILAEVVAVRP